MSGVAVVTTAHGRHEHLRRQRVSLAAGTVVPDLHVVVAMDDPAVAGVAVGDGPPVEVLAIGRDPLGLPLAAARNLGMAHAARAGCDVLIGLDVDCLAGPTMVAGYAATVRDDPATVWSGPVTYLPPPPPRGYDLGSLGRLDDPHPARPAPAPGERRLGAPPELFWSLSYAVGAATWERCGGYCEEYVGYGGEDTDLGRSLLAHGIGLGWTGDARAYHQHHPVSSPPVEHLHDVLRNGRLFRDRWGEWPMRGWLEQFERRGLVRREGEDWVPTEQEAGRRAPGGGRACR